MGEVVSLRLKPFHYPRAVVPDGPQTAAVISFAEHLPPAERANQLDRQADLVLSLTLDLYNTAFNIARQWRDFSLGVHAHHNGRDTCAQKTRGSPKLSPDGAA